MQLDLLNKPSGRTSIITASGFVLDLANPDATGLPVEDYRLTQKRFRILTESLAKLTPSLDLDHVLRGDVGSGDLDAA